MTAPRARTVYRADPAAGDARAVAGDPRAVAATKLEGRFSVDFVSVPCEIATPEGRVRAAAGDAIVTDGAGDRWPVPRDQFQSKYRPLPPTLASMPGVYASRPQSVLALRMDRAFDVMLPDGVSQLSGEHGDWLVDAGGGLYVISAAAFARSYRIDG